MECHLSFHARCLGLQPGDEVGFVCPSCLCEASLKKSVEAVQRILHDSLAKLPENRGSFISTIKHPLVVTVRITELARYIMDYVDPKPIRSLAILPANSELRSGRRKPIQDRTIREFLLTKLPLFANNWLAGLLLQGENVDALKLVSVPHVNSLREWFLLVQRLLQNPSLFLKLSLPNPAQSLPGEVVLLLEECLRLDFYSYPSVLEIIQHFFFITFCGVTHHLVQFPREFEEWKRVQELHELLRLEENEPVFQFVKNVQFLMEFQVDDRAL